MAYKNWIIALAVALWLYLLLPHTATLFYELYHLTGIGFGDDVHFPLHDDVGSICRVTRLKKLLAVFKRKGLTRKREQLQLRWVQLGKHGNFSKQIGFLVQIHDGILMTIR